MFRLTLSLYIYKIKLHILPAYIRVGNVSVKHWTKIPKGRTNHLSSLTFAQNWLFNVVLVFIVLTIDFLSAFKFGFNNSIDVATAKPNRARKGADEIVKNKPRK